ncbi:hypothetical protein AVEN_106126-1 [Araneus ventricosus]|uniref:G-protein coupled receptors family 1 profile domain-containing protein n=1 Tax=Araneus ventricosus TaxID=182803 RepID=A0A4Y2FII8_ARAVE|nr:hypothetical protein AVEN_106126-1 [Araneus ventricosus]
MMTILIWGISLITGCLPLAWKKSTQETKPECNFLSIISNIYIWSFIIPPAILTNITILYVYLRIWVLKRQQQKRISPSTEISGQLFCRSRRYTKATAVVCIIIFSSVFVLTPFLITVILVTTRVVTSNAKLLCSVTYELSFINPMFTPVIFAWRNENFSAALKTIVDKMIAQMSHRFSRRRSEVSEIMEFASTTITNTQSSFAL